jgi:hypothetical protein
MDMKSKLKKIVWQQLKDLNYLLGKENKHLFDLLMES